MSFLEELENKVKDEERTVIEKIKTVKKVVGPGMITGAADDDPSGVATYSIVGASYGLLQNWLVLFLLPMMVATQEICGRIGLVTGKGLAGVIKNHYSRILLFAICSLLVIANTINIAADLSMMAAATKLVLPVSSSALWLFFYVFLIIFLEIFISYRKYSAFLKFLCLSLLAYFATAILVVTNWKEVVFSLFTPHLQFNRDFLFVMVGLLGTTISPYLFFWEASEEVEEASLGGFLSRIWPHELRAMKWDTLAGMFFSQLTAFFIIVTTAMTLHRAGVLEIKTAADAAAALKPLAGNFAFFLFSLGIVGVGLLGIPILAGSGAYALAEALNWEHGLNKNLKQAKGFYAIMALSVIIGFLISLSGIDPIKALLCAAVLNGIITAPLLLVILSIGNSEKIMGKWTNSVLVNLVSWLTFLFFFFAVAALLWVWLVS